MEKIKSDITSKKDDLERAIAFAQFGEKDDSALGRISPLTSTGKWTPVRRAIESLAEKPSLDRKTLEDFKEKYKQPEK